jgi:hypothetical protein
LHLTAFIIHTSPNIDTISTDTKKRKLAKLAGSYLPKNPLLIRRPMHINEQSPKPSEFVTELFRTVLSDYLPPDAVGSLGRDFY